MQTASHITIHPIPALKDNYIWAIVNDENKNVVIVDPGEAQPVINFLDQHHLKLSAILITHHHWDHTNGIADLVKQFNVPVYGSANEKNPHITKVVKENSLVEIPGFPSINVLDIPGHTIGHIAYYSPGILFCGDTLFAAGCGRVFEGTAEQMYSSLQKMSALPDETKVYCAHEYTLNNLRFAATVEPNNKNIIERTQRVNELLAKTKCSLPSIMQDEKQTNPFLRCEISDVISQAEKFTNKNLNNSVDVFAAIRKWKDEFK